jgi:drug/metabolite transporter (DMT)-like permease
MPDDQTNRTRAEALTWAWFVSLALIWGSSFLFIKIGLDEGLPPLTLVTYRLGIATLFLAVLVALTGGRVPRSADALRRLAVLAVLNVAIPFVLITWGAQFIPSAVTSIFNATVPLFTIVIAALVLHDEPITLNRLAGLAIGFAGAVLLASPNLGVAGAADGSDPGTALLGELAVAGGALSYALGVVYARHRITGRPLVDDPQTGPRAPTPVEIALPQVAMAGALILALTLVVERPPNGLIQVPASPAAWLAVAWLGVLGSGVAYLLYFRLIRSWGATRTALVTYALPVVGIALGVIVLSEELHPAEIAGAVLIIGGLLLANAAVGQRRLFGRGQATLRAPAEPER